MIKKFCIWVGIIVCSLLNLFSILFIISKAAIGSGIYLSIAFTLWLLILVGLIKKTDNNLYKFAKWKKGKGWIGLIFIFIGLGALPQCEHNWQCINTIAATCHSKEIKIYQCLECKIEEKRIGNSLGHNWKVEKEIQPTCVLDGEIIYKCELCNENKKEEIKSKNIPHDWKVEKEIQPTFLERGCRTLKCKKCLKEKEEIFGLIKAPISFRLKNYTKDFLGGITLNVSVTNNTDTIINYVEYRIIFLNDVGDVIYSDLDIYKNDSMRWEITGPIKPNRTINFSGYGFYNHNFNGKYTIDKLVVTYANGEKQYISNENFELYSENLIK